MVWTLAQSDGGATFIELLPRLAAVLVAGAILVFAIALLRRRLKAGDEGVARDFSLGDLRRLKAEGKITQEELDRAKGALVDRAKAETLKPAATTKRDAAETRAAELK